MEFFKTVTKIDFLATRKIAMIMSVVVIVAVAGSIAFRGLNLGIDFTGGVVVEMAYPHAVELQKVRDTLAKAGFKDAIVQHFGASNDVLIRLQPQAGVPSKDISPKVVEVLQAAEPDAVKRDNAVVGPQVGNELKEKGTLAMLITLGLILVYVAFRFEYRFALGAIAATVHDVVFTVGFFSVFHIEFNLTVLAAVLAVMGYSLNDTVVVFDRIRENFRRMRKESPIEVMNAAINETLSRTIMTSGMTLLVVIALFAVGGEVMRGFSIALLVGIAVGTYSSIYIASATALMLGVSKADLAVKKKEDMVDDMP